MRILILALAALLVGAAPAPATFHVMRHLHTPAGERDPDLTAQGYAAAERLVGWFAGKPLKAIYVSNYRRSHQTAAPLAAARGLTPVVYDPADTPALLDRLRAERGPVLVVGHSNTVPDIVGGLGGTRPADLTHGDFGDVWTLRAGTVRRERLSD